MTSQVSIEVSQNFMSIAEHATTIGKIIQSKKYNFVRNNCIILYFSWCFDIEHIFLHVSTYL